MSSKAVWIGVAAAAAVAFVVVGVMWPVPKVESAPIPGSPEHRLTGENVDTLCLAMTAWHEARGEWPARGTTVVDLVGGTSPPPDFRFLDGYGRPYALIDRDGVLVGAYSFGANGVDERGRRDDVTCMVR